MNSQIHQSYNLPRISQIKLLIDIKQEIVNKTRKRNLEQLFYQFQVEISWLGTHPKWFWRENQIILAIFQSMLTNSNSSNMLRKKQSNRKREKNYFNKSKSNTKINCRRGLCKNRKMLKIKENSWASIGKKKLTKLMKKNKSNS